MIKKCCVCCKVKVDGKWELSTGHCAGQRITHVYCPFCFAETMDWIERYDMIRGRKLSRTVTGGLAHGV